MEKTPSTQKTAGGDFLLRQRPQVNCASIGCRLEHGGGFVDPPR
jgi:hypothetical protein